MINPKDRTIYLSGPMRGLPNLNYPRFREVATALRNAGAAVYNPAEFEHVGPFPMREAFLDYSAFICNRANLLVLLEGWEKSQGARVERALAEICGVEIVGIADVLFSTYRKISRGV